MSDRDRHAASCPLRSSEAKRTDRCTCTDRSLRDSLEAARGVIENLKAALDRVSK